MTGARHGAAPPISLVGDDLEVRCADGGERRYLSFDTAASTAALPAVLDRVLEFMPSYSSIHRGAGLKSQRSTAAYEDAREKALEFAGRSGTDDVAIFTRNTTEALNQLAYRLRLEKSDVVATTVIEHHANLLPWSRVATCRYVECDGAGQFGVEDVEAALDTSPRPKVLAVSAASNITGWLTPIEQIVETAHARSVPVVVDGAQLAPHRPLPAGADFIAWSGHKMYAPFGAGVLVGPRSAFTDGDPFIAGGGAVDLVDLDEVVWTEPPDREEAGSPNVVGAVAMGAAFDFYEKCGWGAIVDHDRHMSILLKKKLASVPGVRILGPDIATETLPVVSFVMDRVPHPLVAARLSAEEAIGVRHGCFCAHPYLIRLLGLSESDVAKYREDVLRGDRTRMPGAVRASAGINTTEDDVDRLAAALRRIGSGETAPVAYSQDPVTGDYLPDSTSVPWVEGMRPHGSSCSPG